MKAWESFFGPGQGAESGNWKWREEERLKPPRQPALESGTGAAGAKYATAEEEWEVAKQSAWNWLADKVIHSPGMLPALLLNPHAFDSWRFREPSRTATSGREYELRESYDAMQRFLDVIELASGFVTPVVVESALSNGLPAKAWQAMVEIARDTRGSMAISPEALEVEKVRKILTKLLPEAPTKEEIESVLDLMAAWRRQRPTERSTDCHMRCWRRGRKEPSIWVACAVRGG